MYFAGQHALYFILVNTNNSHLRFAGCFMTLADLAPGDIAKLVQIDTADPGVIRLMMLGMVEDTTVRLKNIAIGGDPLEVGFFGTSISLRKEQARHFKVARIPASDYMS